MKTEIIEVGAAKTKENIQFPVVMRNTQTNDVVLFVCPTAGIALGKSSDTAGRLPSYSYIASDDWVVYPMTGKAIVITF